MPPKTAAVRPSAAFLDTIDRRLGYARESSLACECDPVRRGLVTYAAYVQPPELSRSPDDCDPESLQSPV